MLCKSLPGYEEALEKERVKKARARGAPEAQLAQMNKEDRYRMKRQLLQFLLVPVAFITEELS